MEENEVENFSSLANVFVPLGKSTSSGLCLSAKILKERQESSVLDVGRFSLDKTLNFLEIVENLMRLLHVVLVACLEDSPFSLLILLGIPGLQ